MDTELAIKHYLDIAQCTFVPHKHGFLHRTLSFNRHRPNFQLNKAASKLEKLAGDNVLMINDSQQERGRTCVICVFCCLQVTFLPSFLIARAQDSISKDRLHLFRTYSGCTQTPQSHTCTIEQALRAAVACRPFFPPTTINDQNNRPWTYYSELSDALQAPYPVQLLLQEAQRIFGHDRRVGSLISIGTGLPEQKLLNDGMLRPCFVRMAKTQNMYEAALTQSMKLLPQEVYCRFNTPCAISVLKPEWGDISEAHQRSYAYFSHVQEKVSDFVYDGDDSKRAALPYTLNDLCSYID